MAKKDEVLESFIIPSSPADRKKIREQIQDIANVLTEVKLLNESKKDFIANLHNDFKIPKKLIAKLAKVQMEHNYTEISEENSMFELIAESILTESGPAPAAPTASDED